MSVYNRPIKMLVGELKEENVAQKSWKTPLSDGDYEPRVTCKMKRKKPMEQKDKEVKLIMHLHRNLIYKNEYE